VNTTRVEGGQSPSLSHVLNALRLVPGLKVRHSQEIPAQCIAIGNQVVAFIDDLDAWESAAPAHEGEMVEAIQSVAPRIVFKYQYRSGIDYLPGTVSAGYFCVNDITDRPRDLLDRARPVDVSARMRTSGYGDDGLTCDWLRARGTLVDGALQLGREGWRTCVGKIARADFYNELFDTNIGLNWRGCGVLTHRIIEYFRAGVVMVTDPLGPAWPVREDVILEDGVHCVFCEDPARFPEIARSLLRDPARVAAIRRNVVALWETKLCPEAMGAWYWSKLKACSLACDAPA
jgi:hypothetical protein